MWTIKYSAQWIACPFGKNVFPGISFLQHIHNFIFQPSLFKLTENLYSFHWVKLLSWNSQVWLHTWDRFQSKMHNCKGITGASFKPTGYIIWEKLTTDFSDDRAWKSKAIWTVWLVKCLSAIRINWRYSLLKIHNAVTLASCHTSLVKCLKRNRSLHTYLLFTSFQLLLKKAKSIKFTGSQL